MSGPRVWLSRLLGVFRGPAAERELRDELESHIALHVDDLVRSGVDPHEARRLALARLGGVAGVKEAYRDRQGLPLIETAFRDVRYAVRAAARHPGFVAVAVLNLAIGIGVNTAVFSVVNAVLLRRPPYADPDQLVTVHERLPALGEATLGTAQAEFLDYRDRSKAFSSIAGHEREVFDLTGGSEPIRIQVEKATHELFATLGVSPLIGRTFTAEEDDPGAPKVIVIGYQLWQQRYGGSPTAIGSVLRLDEQPYTVIGVMPAEFEFPLTHADVGEPPAAWMPMAFTRREIADRASEFPVHIVGRLAPSVTTAQAQQDLQRVAEGFEREHPDIYTGNLRVEVAVKALGSASAARARPALIALSGAVGFVLLIACANVINLLLARAAARQREIAMRRALGASAGRLVAQLVTEGLLFTSIGAVIGCVLAFAILMALRHLLPWLSASGSLRVDWPVLAFTVVISVITGLLCGLAPATGLSGSRSDVAASLKAGGRDTTSVPRRRVRGLLVVVEAACAVVLLIGAGLLLRSFIHVVRVPLGFSPDDLVMVRTTFNQQRYPSSDRRREVERAMTERLAALPGVEVVGVTTHIPLADERQIGFILEGEDEHDARWADNASVSGSYFQAMGIPLLRGRTFGAQDAPGTPLSAILNDSMARKFWPSGDAVGKRIAWGGRPLTIVGIVGDVHLTALEAEVNPTIYTALYQIDRGPTTNAVFILRGRTASAAAIAPSLRGAIWSVDNGVPVFDVRSMNDVVARSLATRRFTVALLSSFAVVALLLAVIGLYSVLAYGVTQRTPELGVRLALGASPRQLVRLVLGEGLRLTVVGLTLGLAIGIIVARAMTPLLFGVAWFDPLAFAGSALVLLIVALSASGIPARRAAGVDPLIALRSE